MATVFQTHLMNMQEYKNIDGLADVVFQITYNRVGVRIVDGKSYNGNFYANVQLPVPSADDFIPYNELTEEIVLQWLNSVVDMPSVDSIIDTQIDEQVHPTIVDLPYPWLPIPNNN